ncbi:hypothetical protein SEA_DAUBENSKI_143 [Streptomyces phage Daubenski]|uniref:Uncharacterized protein n=1 Tax=Streptomyces phage Daubenski TaxID=2653725 RepID=A0A5Q2WID3_9CAUD|nr:hypothetical protein KNU80_gp139 [Streptomyces phage Daubenski]QGH76433.1 hypothetical protein SEA_DAUBENSKI_143 [Streptomyces phage Daubenski]
MNFDMLSNVPGIEFRLKCSFCPEEADGDLTVELEPGMFIPLPICESCLVEQAKNFNMIESPE